MRNWQAMIESITRVCFIQPIAGDDTTTNLRCIADANSMATILNFMVEDPPKHVHIIGIEFDATNDELSAFFKGLLSISSVESLSLDVEGLNKASHFALLAETAAKLPELSLKTLKCSKIPEQNTQIKAALSFLRFKHSSLILQGSYASAPVPKPFNADDDFPPRDIIRTIGYIRQTDVELYTNPSKKMKFR